MKRNAILLGLIFSMVTATTSSAASCPSTIATANIPCTIASAGFYKFTNNVTTSTTAAAITISADNVILDLAGFELLNTAPWNGFGVSLTGPHKNITVKNGRITGFDRSIHFGGDSIVTDYATNFLIDGINADSQIKAEGNSGIIQNCSAIGTNGTVSNALTAYGSNITIINNDVFGANGNGINVGPDYNNVGAYNIVENNRIKNVGQLYVGQSGIYLPTENSIAVNNRITNNPSITNSPIGIDMSNPTTGIYRDNLTIGCTIPYSVSGGVVNAGNNQ
jgi:hypothetical protein